ncbi:MAG: nitrilase-related carbon-nitrogen hydrolase, partial [Planctomycetota bacterium]
MRVALCQIDCTVGDLTGNAARIADWSAQALAAGAQVAVFPELALLGYPPEDLLVRPSFRANHD